MAVFSNEEGSINTIADDTLAIDQLYYDAGPVTIARVGSVDDAISVSISKGIDTYKNLIVMTTHWTSSTTVLAYNVLLIIPVSLIPSTTEIQIAGFDSYGQFRVKASTDRKSFTLRINSTGTFYFYNLLVLGIR